MLHCLVRAGWTGLTKILFFFFGMVWAVERVALGIMAATGWRGLGSVLFTGKRHHLPAWVVRHVASAQKTGRMWGIYILSLSLFLFLHCCNGACNKYSTYRIFLIQGLQNNCKKQVVAWIHPFMDRSIAWVPYPPLLGYGLVGVVRRM